jgi:2-dehydro-3-deoxy-D-arabinonate dehydratase
MAIFRLQVGRTERLAVGDAALGPSALLHTSITLDGLLANGSQRMAEIHRQGGIEPVPDSYRILVPVGGQEIWAAGVTYLRSRIARTEESSYSDPYDRVYGSDRPELFLKCAPGKARGPGALIGVRRDSTWDVPEPELALVLDAEGEIAAYTIGNDVSSRSIEGENSLYLPQAKTYTGSCSLGPCLVSPDEVGDPMNMTIRLEIYRGEVSIFDGRTSTSEMRRHVDDLRRWLFLANDFPLGAFLLTGTGIVPPAEVTLSPGDVTRISVDGLGSLTNTVEEVGRSEPAEERRLYASARPPPGWKRYKW